MAAVPNHHEREQAEQAAQELLAAVAAALRKEDRRPAVDSQVESLPASDSEAVSDFLRERPQAVSVLLEESSRAVAVEIAAEAVSTRHTARALGEAIRSARAPATPALAAAAQARESLYDSIADEFGLLTSAQAGEAMGSRSSASRNLAAKARGEGRALALVRGRYTLFPGFQFSDSGLRPVIADLRTVGEEYGRTETGLIQWLVSPTTYLHGKRPVDVIDEPDTLLDVARRSFDVEW